MKNKDDRLYELSKELFLKAGGRPTFLTDQTQSWFNSAMDDSIRVAKLFIAKFEEKKDDKN